MIKQTKLNNITIMENKEQLIKQATEIIKNDFMVKRHLYPYTWLSGSSTDVYPITGWVESGEIVIQLNSVNKNIFEKTIKRIIEKSNGLIVWGYFNKRDGSCPNTLNFILNYSWKAKILC